MSDWTIIVARRIDGQRVDVDPYEVCCCDLDRALRAEYAHPLPLVSIEVAEA